MARPKTPGKKRQNMMLTVTPEIRKTLAFISEYHGESISALVSKWAKEEESRIKGTDEEKEGE